MVSQSDDQKPHDMTYAAGLQGGRTIARGVTQNFPSGTYFSQRKVENTAEETYNVQLREAWTQWLVNKRVWHHPTVPSVSPTPAPVPTTSAAATETEAPALAIAPTQAASDHPGPLGSAPAVQRPSMASEDATQAPEPLGQGFN